MVFQVEVPEEKIDQLNETEKIVLFLQHPQQDLIF